MRALRRQSQFPNKLGEPSAGQVLSSALDDGLVGVFASGSLNGPAIAMPKLAVPDRRWQRAALGGGAQARSLSENR